ncbi:MAG: hypothetical protein U0414_10170 [Polyangiaceae bacterium]
MMEGRASGRREWLIGSAATAGLLSGCTPSLRGAGESASALVPPEEVEASWREILRTRDAVGKGTLPLDDVLARGRSVGRTWEREAVATKAARTLFLSGAFRDLPEDARAHPFVQGTMFDAAPEFDDAIRGMRARLDALTPTERADLQRELREDPELAERVVALLDGEVARAGASDARRLHLRRLGLTVCDRLSQSSSGLIDEYSQSLDKVYARFGDEVEVERKIAASMGHEAYDAVKARLEAAAERYRVAGVMRISGTPAPPPPSSAKKATLIAGLVFIGLGIVGGAFAPLTFFISACVGGVFLIAGIVLLIISAAI